MGRLTFYHTHPIGQTSTLAGYRQAARGFAFLDNLRERAHSNATLRGDLAMIDRRSFIGMGTAAGLLSGATVSSAFASEAGGGATGVVVETTSGKVAGTTQG